MKVAVAKPQNPIHEEHAQARLKPTPHPQHRGDDRQLKHELCGEKDRECGDGAEPLTREVQLAPHVEEAAKHERLRHGAARRQRDREEQDERTPALSPDSSFNQTLRQSCARAQPCQTFRECVGEGGRKSFLFNSSICENLRMGRPLVR